MRADVVRGDVMRGDVMRGDVMRGDRQLSHSYDVAARYNAALFFQ